MPPPIINPNPGVEPFLVVTPSIVNLGPTVAGRSLSQLITLIAKGTPIGVISVSITGSGWSITGAGWVPVTIPLNSQQTLTVNITQAANGVYPGTLTINTTIGIIQVPLSATYAAGLVYQGATGNGFPPDKPGQVSSIIAASQSGAVVTLTLATPIYYVIGSSLGIAVAIGIVGYDGTWEIGTVSSDGKTVTYTAITTGLAPFNSSSGTPPGLLTTLSIALLSFYNPTGASITISGITVNDPNFTFPGLSTENGGAASFPFVITAGNSGFVEMFYNHAELGQITVTLTVANNGSVPSLVIQILAYTVAVFPFSPLNGTGLTVAFGTNTSKVYNADTLPSNGAIDSVLIFNDPLWEQPGMEKTLIRLEVFYENFGVCQLKLLLQSFRQAMNNGAGGIDQQLGTILIGDVTADGSDRSAFFDLEISGEVILATVTRPANSGICSLTGFTPHFADRGEKVENA